MTKIYRADEALERTLAALNEIAGGVEPDIPTGYPQLDAYIHGLRKGKLIVLGARYPIGINVLSLNIVRNIFHWKPSCRIMYCSSGESDEIEIMSQLLSLETDISLCSMCRGLRPEDLQALTATASCLKKFPLWVVSHSGTTTSAFCEKIREFTASTPVDLIVADCLQYLSVVPDETAPQQLKQLAEDMNVAILAYARYRYRKKRLPRFSLPPGVEEYADTVLRLDRDRDDRLDTDPEKPMNISLYIEKNRMGYTGIVPLKFFPDEMKYRNGSYEFEE